MSETKEPYIIEGSDPEEVLEVGPLRFIRSLDSGQVRIETRAYRGHSIHTMTEGEGKELIEFLLEGRKETTMLITISDSEGDEGEDLQGARADFLEIEG